MSDNNNININTPEIGPYTQLTPFRFWCQKVLPLVYDDSLSYYELLCKVVDYLNKTMEDVDQMITDMGDFQGAYTEFTTETRDAYIAFTRGVNDTLERLETYMNNYFNNLDVQQEINNKLDAMAEAGYFSDLFNTLFRSDLIAEAASVTGTWIGNNLLQETGYVIDSSLTTQNAAADAKATGDRFVNDETAISQKALKTILDPDNVLIDSVRYEGKYYDTTWHDSATYDVYVVPVVSGQTYHFTRITSASLVYEPRMVSKEGVNIVNNSTAVAGVYDYTADFTGDLYVTYYANDEPYAYKTNRSGTFEKPYLNNLVNTDRVEKGYASSPLGVYAALKNTLSSIVDDKNLLYYAERIPGKYIYPAVNQVPKLLTNADLTTFRLYLTAGTYKVAAGVRFICEEDAESYILSGSPQPSEYTVTISTDDIYYFTFYTPDGSGKYVYNNADSPLISVGGYGAALLKSSEKQNKIYFEDSAATLDDEESLTLPVMTVAKNVIYNFACKITTLGKIKIGRGGSTQVYATWIEIDDTNLVIHIYRDTLETVTLAHGLTISDYLFVTITTDDKYHAVIKLFSNGQEYTSSSVEFFANCRASAFATSDESTLTDAKFVMTCRDASRNVYLFGDSYLNYNANNRWCYYLKPEYLDNVMILAFGGASSLAGADCVESMGTNTRAKIALWAYGMNDGSDSSSAPSSQWLTGMNKFLDWCKANYVEPVLATIPTVPSINNNKKNEWVKASGYRYIDFEKAVGAQSDGTWYTGMLSADNIHPTITGAIALYNQAILDMPEITSFK